MKPAIVELFLNGADASLTLQLREGIAIVANPALSAEDLARAYRSAPPVVSVNTAGNWAIVAAGPLLDTPDSVHVLSATLENRLFRIQLVHTSARLRHAGLRRNRQWRPLMTLKLGHDLAAGRYEVQVRWHALETLPSGKELEPVQQAAPLVFTVER